VRKNDGPEIASESMERVFDPFFTTREIGQGARLGLGICHGIITEHSGRYTLKVCQVRKPPLL